MKRVIESFSSQLLKINPLKCCAIRLRMIIGNKDIYGFELGNNESKSLKVVDIIIGNRYVSCDDNTVYLPQFINDVKSTLESLQHIDYTTYDKYYKNKTIEKIHQFISGNWEEGSESFNIEDGQVYSLHRFMDWGPTTDNITSLLFLYNNELILTYQFWREGHEVKEEINRVNYVKVKKSNLIETLENLVHELEKA